MQQASSALVRRSWYDGALLDVHTGSREVQAAAKACAAARCAAESRWSTHGATGESGADQWGIVWAYPTRSP